MLSQQQFGNMDLGKEVAKVNLEKQPSKGAFHSMGKTLFELKLLKLLLVLIVGNTFVPLALFFFLFFLFPFVCPCLAQSTLFLKKGWKIPKHTLDPSSCYAHFELVVYMEPLLLQHLSQPLLYYDFLPKFSNHCYQVSIKRNFQITITTHERISQILTLENFIIFKK